MKKLILLALTVFTISFVNAQVSIGVTPYTTLQAAFAAINAGTHTGAITVTITGNTTETGTAVLNASGTGSANYTSVTVYPTSSGLKISGSLNAPLIDLNGADNVTFDGRVNATGSTIDLQILNSNTGALASTFRFIESAQTNLINYCILKGASQNATGGVLFFSTATTGTGNSNNTITHNNITGITTADANRPINCIFSSGTATRENNGNIISNNNFFDFDKISVACSAIKLSANTSNWTISSNSFYQTTTVSKTAAGANLTVINISNTGTTYTINGNFVGGNAANCSGTAWTTNGAFNQQFFGFLISSGSCSVQGNTISNINWTSQHINPFYGTQILAGTYDIGSTSGNTYGSATGTGSITIKNTTANSGSFGINLQSSGNGTVSNNSIGSFTVIGSATFSHNFKGILNNANNTLTISNNIIGSTSTANSILASSASTSAAGQSVIGIISTGNGTVNANGNSICNLSDNYTGTNANGQVIGIKTTNGVNNLLNNTITNLSTSSANAGVNGSASVIGILQTSLVAGQVVSSNTIHNLANTSATAIVSDYGIYYSGPTSGTNIINGNFIRTLTLSSSSTTSNISGIKADGGSTTISNNIITLGTGVSTGYIINGIYENGAAGNNNNIYFNTVYLAGTQASGSNSAAFYSNANTNTRDIRNNIFDNARSNGGSHYAAFFNYATAGTLTLNYNDYFASGTGGVLGFFNGSNVAALPLIAGNDANSQAINPA
ncbi:MAG TPA: hypothetical protein VFJ43_04190, partial [Bacteroidia bacterium]|nr:hypothetical protein [Bacteroidia bacterium]